MPQLDALRRSQSDTAAVVYEDLQGTGIVLPKDLWALMKTQKHILWCVNVYKFQSMNGYSNNYIVDMVPVDQGVCR